MHFKVCAVEQIALKKILNRWITLNTSEGIFTAKITINTSVGISTRK